MIKFGVIGFSYAGFDSFASWIDSVGYYTSNLGDNAQTVAGRHAFQQAGVADADVIRVDRDTLTTYDGPPVALLMNGVFYEKTLPAPDHVTPIFLGFHADSTAIASHADWLRRHQPIGCRDPHTAELCRANGVEAFVTGCVTMTLPPRAAAPENGKFFVVLGWPHLLPPVVYKSIPPELFDRVEFIQHRKVEGTIPLTPEMQKLNEAYERDLIRKYRDEAALVLTPLLHVASPCVAMKVPVIICRHDHDPRFGHIKSALPVHTAETIRAIDWNPAPADLGADAATYLRLLGEKVSHIQRTAQAHV